MPKQRKQQQQQSRNKGKPRRSNPPVTHNVPLAYSKSVKTGAPKTKMLSNGSIRVVHREFVSDVISSNGFAVRKFALNPGDSSSFKWLSGMARLYESYVFRRLKVEYIGACSATLGGRILMAVDYDPADSAPVDKVDAASYQGSVSTSPWVSETLVCDPRALTKLKERYVRSSSTVSLTPGDLRTYDSGNVFIMTTGFEYGSQLCGEIYFEYEVDLMTPQRLNAAEDSTIDNLTNAAQTTDIKGNGRIKDQFGYVRGVGTTTADWFQDAAVTPAINHIGPAIERIYQAPQVPGGPGFTEILFRNAGRYILNQTIGLASVGNVASMSWPSVRAALGSTGLANVTTLDTFPGNIAQTNGTAASRSLILDILQGGVRVVFDNFADNFRSDPAVPTTGGYTNNATGVSRLRTLLQPFVGVGHELVPISMLQEVSVEQGVGTPGDRDHALSEYVDASYIRSSPASAGSFPSHGFVKQGGSGFPQMFDR